MRAVKFRITSLSPLLFASNTGDPNMVATLDYIPGTHIRGMFANEYIKRKGLGVKAHEDSTFYNWFLKGDLKFTNAYIVQKNNNEIHGLFPIPLSIQCEKGKEEAYDLLLQDDESDMQTVPISGYGRIDKSNSDKKKVLYKKEVKKSLNFHHARDREKGVSKEGYIFNYESIDENQTFEGYIIGNDEVITQFIDFIKELNKDVFYLGRSKNNQYGKVKFEIISTQPEEFLSEIKIEQGYLDNVIITLLSDTIIYNENGYSTTNLIDLENELKKHLGQEVKIKKAFIRQTDQEGFVSVWKLKTPSEVCFKAGSCFLLENLEDADIEKLKELQKTGIGMRTHEGFGRFVVGWQDESEFDVVKVEDEIEITKPNQIPDEVKELIKNIIKEKLKSELQIEAIEDAGDFTKDCKELPSRSLLAKLESAVKEGKFKDLFKDDEDDKNDENGKLKKSARDKLENCRKEDTTLYEFLKNFSLNVEDKMKKMKNKLELKNLYDEIAYKPEREFKSELEKIYLLTFLSTMRKKIKQLEKEGKRKGGE
jgi:CRISPR-associated protein Csx10